MEDSLPIANVAIEVTFTQASADALKTFWKRIFRGAAAQGTSPLCRMLAYAGADLDFDFLQSLGEIADPGEHTVTVRACTHEPLGAGFACHEVKGGTAGKPHIAMHGIASGSVE